MRRKDKALGKAAALLIASQKSRPAEAKTGKKDRGRGHCKALEILDTAIAAGAQAREVAVLLGIGLSKLQRWRRDFAGDWYSQDRRKGSQRLVSRRLSQEECQRMLITFKQPEYALLLPGQKIAPTPVNRG
jgi:putative transposase